MAITEMLNYKLQITNFGKKRGFSLIEILIVLVLFVTVALVINQSLFNTLRGSTKSNLTTRVKQEGNFAISVMERRLRLATQISCSYGRIIDYKDTDGVKSDFICQNSTLTNGGVLLLPSDIKVSACSFTCLKFGGKDTVSVKITFSQAKVSSRSEEQVSVPLETTIRLRN